MGVLRGTPLKSCGPQTQILSRDESDSNLHQLGLVCDPKNAMQCGISICDACHSTVIYLSMACLAGYDQFMNIVLDNTVEIVSPTEKNEIGMVVIRGLMEAIMI